MPRHVVRHSIAKIVRLRPRPQKSPAFRDGEPETADRGSDRGDLGLRSVTVPADGQKRVTAYSEAVVRVVGEVADRPVLGAENGFDVWTWWMEAEKTK